MAIGDSYVKQALQHREQAKICRKFGDILEVYHWRKAEEFMSRARALIQYHHQRKGNVAEAEHHARKMVVQNQRMVARMMREVWY
ncbi:hypothetical protein K5_163 [Pseudomonas phage K5]|uniref:Uncharacterized protein n=1 Tax=Pseudomonas phage vB_PaeM_LCK69 TaxID=2488595 RepID=A0A3G8F7Y5_9CAUD|nr:hypothetical protein AU075_gp062 [Pseudomonas phage C11]YP_009200100.1 hypothetical protein K8_164 [Pseudomonas phage K8]YP_009273918.1 hypothetical protein BH773_gp065 [Pseudomonas phage K5]YP_010763805.1 hypothetical protein QE332_gp087 [Pseudomonas phage vB_PaeM_LCK69]AXC34625.1 hypothetical protein [Pseudomonas phage SRT6]AXY86851.1 hypothetical protein PaYy2_57 [Pseudomonas phage PaYy-2]QAU05433.1 hypothetical protein S2_161 [Pseudomonas phage vB_PaeM_SCUT-S2]ALF51485.1 hypothetical 